VSLPCWDFGASLVLQEGAVPGCASGALYVSHVQCLSADVGERREGAVPMMTGCHRIWKGAVSGWVYGQALCVSLPVPSYLSINGHVVSPLFTVVLTASTTAPLEITAFFGQKFSKAKLRILPWGREPGLG
jgi:hypothetical protein